MLFEIRNYHFDPSKFEAYKIWTQGEAAPYLKANLNVVGFWFDNGVKPIITGTNPMELEHGTANASWIIRWESMQQRNQNFNAVISSKEWLDIWSRHPDANGYLQMEVRFAEEV